jgi:raffinose/stachyose/melibiose transport system substrate-binding protein
MLKKPVALFTAGLLLVSTLAGCSSSAKNTSAASSQTSTAAQTKLVFYSGTAELVDFWNTFFSEYNSANKDGITVEQQYQKEATNTLQVKMASGDVPDLISCSTTQDMIDNNKFVDLTDMSFWSDISTEMKSYTVDVKSGKNYCVPFLQSEVGLIYNKTIFNELGLKQAKTWDEFVANLKTIKEKKPDVTPFYIGAKDGWMLNQMAQFTMMSPAMQNLSYADQQNAMQDGDFTKLGWDNSSSGAIATFAKDLLELQKDGLVNSDIVTATYDNQTTAFAQGKAVFICQGLWAMSNIAKVNSDTSFAGITYYPAMIDGVKPAIGSAPDGDIYISSSSKNVDASEKVLTYILQADNLKKVSEAKQEPSTNPKVDSDWGVLKDDVSSLTNDSSVAKLTWDSSPSGFSGDDQGKMIQELFAGGFKTPEAFADSWLAAWKKGLSK